MFPKIIVNSPWYFFVLSILFGLGIALWLYGKNKKNQNVPKIIVYSLFSLRFLSLSFIAFFLLSVFLKRVKNETENPIILFALDNSSSVVSGADSAAIKNILDNKISSLKKQIAENYEIKTILFGSKIRTSDEVPDFSEKETDIENLIQEVENNYSNQNIGALVIASDGIYNKGANPVYVAEKIEFPIYCIALGDTQEIKDVLIQKINHNQIAFAGNNFPAEVIINAKKFAGKEVSVSLSVNGIEKLKQNLKINSDNYLSNCTFTLSAEQPGILKCTARVSTLEGEKNTANNVQSFIVEVIDNKEKVLLLANAPHPDISALREAILNNTSYQLDYSLTYDLKKPLKLYNLVIFHGFSNEQIALLNDCKNNSIPFWIISPLTTDNIPGVKINSSYRGNNDAEACTEETFGLFNLSKEFKKFVSDLPATKTYFGKYTLLNSSSSLFNQKIGEVETKNPLFFFNDINGLKTACFLGDGLWKWNMRDFVEHSNHNLFNELVSKTIQYLSVKNDKSFFRLAYPKIVNENEAFEINGEVYNKSYELITDPEVSLILSNSEGKKYNYTFNKTANSYKLNFGLLPPGEFSFEAKVKSGNDFFVKKGSFAIKEVVVEKINTVANHHLLYQLSNRTDGELYYPNELDQLKMNLLKNERIKPVTYSQNTTTLLIDLKWLFWMVLILLLGEWFLRKRYFPI